MKPETFKLEWTFDHLDQSLNCVRVMTWKKDLEEWLKANEARAHHAVEFGFEEINDPMDLHFHVWIEVSDRDTALMLKLALNP